MTCTTSSSSPLTISIANAFSSSGYTTTGTSFTLTFWGLTNPVSTTPTGSFTVYTMDSNSDKIEYDNDQIIATMTSLSPLTSFSPSLVSYVNGATSDLTISI